MSKYRVRLTALAAVETYVEVEAADQDEAMDLAIATAEDGAVVWEYQGAEDNTIEAQEATRVAEVA